jgi:hypothetical protein
MLGGLDVILSAAKDLQLRPTELQIPRRCAPRDDEGRVSGG